MLKSLLSCTALIALSTAQLCQAQPTAKMAYVSDSDSGGFELFVMDTDGTNRTALTKDSSITFGGHEDYQIAWSPDGSRIAVPLGTGTNREIFVMDADGSNPINLTNGQGWDTSPTWSPDGRQIAFASSSSSLGFAEIYLMNTDGSNLVQLTHDSADDRAPSWSPDGRQIAFASRRQSSFYQIFVINTDGSNLVQLTDSERQNLAPIWSPDGSRIAYFSGNCLDISILCNHRSDIMVMDNDGGNVVKLTDNDSANSFAAWSPDGSQIAFTSNRHRGRFYDIYVMDADGSNVANLTNATPGVSFLFPAWAPVGAPATTLIEATSWGEVKVQTALKK